MPGAASAQNSTGRRAEKAERWNSVKDEVRQFYIQENRKLEETREIVQRNHSFTASLRKWKDMIKIWGFDKYISKDDMSFFVAKAEKRRREEGKETQFLFRGTEIKEEKISNFKKRKTDGENMGNGIVGTPPNVTYHTPVTMEEDLGIEIEPLLHPRPSDRPASTSSELQPATVFSSPMLMKNCPVSRMSPVPFIEPSRHSVKPSSTISHNSCMIRTVSQTVDGGSAEPEALMCIEMRSLKEASQFPILQEFNFSTPRPDWKGLITLDDNALFLHVTSEIPKETTGTIAWTRNPYNEIYYLLRIFATAWQIDSVPDRLLSYASEHLEFLAISKKSLSHTWGIKKTEITYRTLSNKYSDTFGDSAEPTLQMLSEYAQVLTFSNRTEAEITYTKAISGFGRLQKWDRQLYCQLCFALTFENVGSCRKAKMHAASLLSQYFLCDLQSWVNCENWSHSTDNFSRKRNSFSRKSNSFWITGDPVRNSVYGPGLVGFLCSFRDLVSSKMRDPFCAHQAASFHAKFLKATMEFADYLELSRGFDERHEGPGPDCSSHLWSVLHYVVDSLQSPTSWEVKICFSLYRMRTESCKVGQAWADTFINTAITTYREICQLAQQGHSCAAAISDSLRIFSDAQTTRRRRKLTPLEFEKVDRLRAAMETVHEAVASGNTHTIVIQTETELKSTIKAPTFGLDDIVDLTLGEADDDFGGDKIGGSVSLCSGSSHQYGTTYTDGSVMTGVSFNYSSLLG